jgi:hypothetical protein
MSSLSFKDLPTDIIIYEIFEYLEFDSLVISKYFHNVKIYNCKCTLLDHIGIFECLQ